MPAIPVFERPVASRVGAGAGSVEVAQHAPTCLRQFGPARPRLPAAVYSVWPRAMRCTAYVVVVGAGCANRHHRAGPGNAHGGGGAGWMAERAVDVVAAPPMATVAVVEFAVALRVGAAARPVEAAERSARLRGQWFELEHRGHWYVVARPLLGLTVDEAGVDVKDGERTQLRQVVHTGATKCGSGGTQMQTVRCCV